MVIVLKVRTIRKKERKNRLKDSADPRIGHSI